MPAAKHIRALLERGIATEIMRILPNKTYSCVLVFESGREIDAWPIPNVTADDHLIYVGEDQNIYVWSAEDEGWLTYGTTGNKIKLSLESLRVVLVALKAAQARAA